jgi:hypothetical protein
MMAPNCVNVIRKLSGRTIWGRKLRLPEIKLRITGFRVKPGMTIKGEGLLQQCYLTSAVCN